MKKGKIAICTLPGIAGGGVFTVFLNLKQNLELLGWSVTGISIGNTPWAPLYQEAPYDCVRIAGHLDAKASPKEAAMAFVGWCVNNGIDIIVPMNSPVVTSAIPFLPTSVKVVMFCNNNPPRVYKYISTFPAYTSRWIFIAKGQLDDTRSFGFSKEKVELLPIGVKSSAGVECLSKGNSAKLKLGFLGRIHHAHKGVLLLPKILQELDQKQCLYTLEIIGAGQDEQTLKLLMQEKVKNGSVIFKGAVDFEEVPGLIKEWDIFIMPSRYEGLPGVLLETMECGVVPVASKLPGITDWVVQHGQNGFLCDMNEVVQFAEAIYRLDRDRELLMKMSRKARIEIHTRFLLEESMKKYDHLLSQVLAESCREIPTKKWAEWKPYIEYRPPYSYLTSLFPLFLKSFLKKKLMKRLR